ncbi:MAG: rhodanese-like domain-containing protein, partial [Rhodobacteraceae bacterium]|nr:rhodanese-like domain-containing protein [Paracoccaceae bacterium]
PSPLGQMLSVDFSTWRVSQFRFDGAREPEEIFPAIIARGEVGNNDLLIDLRAEDPGDPAQLSPDPGQRVVFLCASGLRAWRAAKILADKWHGRVAICAVGS